MQTILTLWDTRLGSNKPQGYEVFKAEETTSLALAIQWLARKGRKYNANYVRALILCHGWSSYIPHVGAAGSEGAIDDVSQGGGGLQFCKEGINIGTMKAFHIIKDLVDRIDILGCGAAYITPGCEGQDGDGNFLCSRLAQITGAEVRASTSPQTYMPDNNDFGRWEGTVLTYGPSGKVIKVEHSPPGPFD